MKPTINQINGRVRINPTINFYKYLCTDKSRWSDDWRHRYFNYKNSNGRVVRLSPKGNDLYIAAEKEFSRIVGNYSSNRSYDINIRHSERFEINFCHKTICFKLHLSQSMYGVLLQVETNFKPIYNGGCLAQYNVRSNEKFNNLDIQAYFEKHILPKYMYPEGIFRNIQIVENCSKKEALAYYRKYISNKSTIIKDSTEPIDTFAAVVKRIKRKLNILVCVDISEARLYVILKTYKRQPKLTRMYKQPSFFELADLYCQEFDTDGNEEGFINSYFEENYSENAIFV